MRERVAGAMVFGVPCAAVRFGFYSKKRGVGWGGVKQRRDMPVLSSSKIPLSSRGGRTVRGED